MFQAISFNHYDPEQEINYLIVTDRCLPEKYMLIETMAGSPSVEKNLTNAIVAYTLFHFYENKRRSVSRNMALYFKYMRDAGYQIDNNFILIQIKAIDKLFRKRYRKKYFRSIIKRFEKLVRTQNLNSGLDEIFRFAF